MFIKAFRVKSQTQVKGSDRKKLRADLAQQFPSLSSDALTQLIPSKGDMALVRLNCSKEESVVVYQVGKDPLFFAIEKEKKIYPTVYTLWQYPSLLHVYTTHERVIEKLAGGADLMLPGIITHGEATPDSYGRLEKGTLVAINTDSNTAPVAIGTTALSSMDMYMSGKHGRGVTILHVCGDYLWQMGSKGSPPEMEIPDVVRSSNQDTSCEELVVEASEDSVDVAVSELKLQELSVNDVQETECTESAENFGDEEKLQDDTQLELNDPKVMDELLLHCLLKALKVYRGKVELPVLTSSFYRLHMVPVCPDGRVLNVKKSSYKKLSKFLEAMSQKGLLTVVEFPKGVENINSINYDHEEIVQFIVDKTETTEKPTERDDDDDEGFVPPTMEELYQVSGDTINFFRANGLSKGDVLSVSEVRTVVTDYIKKKKLRAEGQNIVNLDPLLHEAVVNRKEGYKETLRWDEIFSRFLGRMSPAVRITRSGQSPIVRKGKLEPIEIMTANRTGNKKVTLIYNVGTFGIDEREFAHQIQVGVAASTSVGPAEHKPRGTIQVLVQGNQVTYVSKLLLESYKIPKKYIRGLQLDTKKKKRS